MKSRIVILIALMLFAVSARAVVSVNIDSGPIVEIGEDVHVKTNQTARQVVVIAGDVIIDGSVDQDVVVIGGDVQLNGTVGHDVVVVMGDVTYGPHSVVRHNVVTVGGSSALAATGTVEGVVKNVGLPAVLHIHWLQQWLRECVFKLRPLSFRIGWVWWFVGVAFFIYLMMAILFPYPVAKCRAQLSERPALSFAAALLFKLATPIILILLTLTLVGSFFIPFIFVAELLALIVGKVALLEYLGAKLVSAFGWGENRSPALMLALGALLVVVCYVIPVIGLLAFIVLNLWGLGAAIMAVAVALRRDKALPASVPISPAPVYAGTSVSGVPFVSEAPPMSEASVTPPPVMPFGHPLASPRAGFWARMAAGFLDLILVGVFAHWTGPFIILAYIAYFSGLWTWKGTTIGGIVLHLQVVRLNGQPMDFLTAFIRCLAAFFSIAVLFLGFFWIAWDSDKQGWHDKIAGTVVVRLPKPVPLVCI